MNRLQFTLLRIGFRVGDLLIITACILLMLYLSIYVGLMDTIFSAMILLPAMALWIISSYIFRLYQSYTVRRIENIHKATLRSCIIFIIIFTIYLYNVANIKEAILFASLLSPVLLTGMLLSRYIITAIKPSIHLNFKRPKTDVLAISSKGGHWVELLRLMPALNKTHVTFISNQVNLKDTVPGYNFYTVPDANRKSMLKLILCAGYVLWFILLIRPQVIISTGAAPGLAAILFGKLLGIKTIWVDSIANADKLSLSGLISLTLADRVYTQWPDLSTSKVTFSGSILNK